MERFNIELKKRDCSGIYAVTQRLMTYNSNKIAGSTLTEERIAFLFDTGSLPPSDHDYRANNERINGWIIGEYRSSDIDITSQMKELLRWYHAGEKTLHTLAEFHVCYNHIQPFQSGNGRVGRLILFRECLRNGIIPFIMEAENKGNYINSLELAQKGDLEPLEKFFEKEQEVYQKEVEYFI